MENIKDLISSRVVDFVGPSEMMEAIASKYRKVAKDIYYFEDGVSENYIFQFFGLVLIQIFLMSILMLD